MRMRIQDLFDPGSGMEKFRFEIRHKHPRSATLIKLIFTFCWNGYGSGRANKMMPILPNPDTTPLLVWSPILVLCIFTTRQLLQVVKSLLKILNLAHEDNGTYLCYGQNAHSSYTAIVEALVYDVPSVRWALLHLQSRSNIFDQSCRAVNISLAPAPRSCKSELRLRLQLLQEHFSGLWFSFFAQIVLLVPWKLSSLIWVGTGTSLHGLMQPWLFP